MKSNKPETSKLLYDPDHCILYGAFVRAARGALGLSQAELAAMLGVTRTTVVRLEQGIAPLRLALCESAVDTLKAAGVSSTAMDQLRHEIGVPTSLDVSINFFKLLNNFLKLPRDAETAKKLESLFGSSYIPTLYRKPLRKNK